MYTYLGFFIFVIKRKHIQNKKHLYNINYVFKSLFIWIKYHKLHFYEKRSLIFYFKINNYFLFP